VKFGEDYMFVTKDKIDKIVDICKLYGATRLILFGSALSSPDEARDIDIACDGVEGWKFFELGGKLEDELMIPLDLIPLTPKDEFSEYIEKTGKVIYEL
jgi:uncharacterized protein